MNRQDPRDRTTPGLDWHKSPSDLIIAVFLNIIQVGREKKFLIMLEIGEHE